MNKLELIKQITDHHPALGSHLNLSWYVGGMRDSGDWYYRKLMDMEEDALQKVLAELQATAPQQDIRSLDEQIRSEKKALEDHHRTTEQYLMWGKP